MLPLLQAVFAIYSRAQDLFILILRSDLKKCLLYFNEKTDILDSAIWQKIQASEAVMKTSQLFGTYIMTRDFKNKVNNSRRCSWNKAKML